MCKFRIRIGYTESRFDRKWVVILKDGLLKEPHQHRQKRGWKHSNCIFETRHVQPSCMRGNVAAYVWSEDIGSVAPRGYV